MKKLAMGCSDFIMPLAATCGQRAAKEMSRRVDQRIVDKLAEQSKDLPAYYDPATMTPWMEDYYYGRKLR